MHLQAWLTLVSRLSVLSTSFRWLSLSCRCRRLLVVLLPCQELGKLLARWDAAWDAAHAAVPTAVMADAPRRCTSTSTVASAARSPSGQTAARGAARCTGLPARGVQTPPAGTGDAGQASCSSAGSRRRRGGKGSARLGLEQGPELAGLPVMYSLEERAIYKCT